MGEFNGKEEETKEGSNSLEQMVSEAHSIIDEAHHLYPVGVRVIKGGRSTK